MKNKAKILIQVKDVGFTFLLDKRMKHNLISPTFLAFFKIGKQRDSLLNNDIGEVNIKPEYNNSFPFLLSYVDSISLEDTFHYVGKKVVWCSDNKFRECKAVKFNFEYEGHPYSELFFIDKSVEEDYAILGSTFWSSFNAE
ncbi:hypothetical protein HMPREF1062_03086 [Bacteroides cellulosilyticus CL02T12C19]|jgi:hypothetical protein|uniref:Uncharacterized protein n=1 Tax=Bacteroides cellulosilyticus CL02T12C19 TaxID=997874 RepID=I9QJM7_9BACE|nr:hypothetical protein [Bacteroides cellulosilyticus]EIY29741.1 hypothetical protein HMPREF1062_03086 [Bacteroides cellulosilyticus CL02T12C19]